MNIEVDNCISCEAEGGHGVVLIIGHRVNATHFSEEETRKLCDLLQAVIAQWDREGEEDHAD